MIATIAICFVVCLLMKNLLIFYKSYQETKMRWSEKDCTPIICPDPSSGNCEKRQKFFCVYVITYKKMSGKTGHFLHHRKDIDYLWESSLVISSQVIPFSTIRTTIWYRKSDISDFISSGFGFLEAITISVASSPSFFRIWSKPLSNKVFV